MVHYFHLNVQLSCLCGTMPLYENYLVTWVTKFPSSSTVIEFLSFFFLVKKLIKNNPPCMTCHWKNLLWEPRIALSAVVYPRGPVMTVNSCIETLVHLIEGPLWQLKSIRALEIRSSRDVFTINFLPHVESGVHVSVIKITSIYFQDLSAKRSWVALPMMTSPKIKLRNYRFFLVSTFTRYYST